MELTESEKRELQAVRELDKFLEELEGALEWLAKEYRLEMVRADWFAVGDLLRKHGKLEGKDGK